MKYTLATLLIFLLKTYCLLAQKKTIDSNSLVNWPHVGFAIISNHGKYIAYTIDTTASPCNTLILQATDNSWMVKIPNASTAYRTKFTADDSYAIYINSQDSLVIRKLGTSESKSIPNVSSFAVSDFKQHDWLLYETKNNKELHLFDLKRNTKRFILMDVQYYLPSNDCENIVTISKTTDTSMILQWINLKSGTKKIVYKSNSIDNLHTDFDHGQLAFTTQKTNKDGPSTTLYIYKNTSHPSVTALICDSAIKNKKLSITQIESFSENGKYLFVRIRDKNDEIVERTFNKLKIWSYVDKKLLSQKIKEGNATQTYLFSIDLTSSKMIRIEEKNEARLKINKDVAVVENTYRDLGIGESTWNSTQDVSYAFVNIKNGTRKPVNKRGTLSPDGKFYVYFDENSNNYYSYEIPTDSLRNITKPIETNWLDYYRFDKFGTERGIAGWLDNGEDVLIYDNFDIWKVNLLQKHPPQNLTNPIREKSYIIFSISDENKKTFKPKEKIILDAFNIRTKQNGFYQMETEQISSPQCLFMGDFVFDIKNNPGIPEGSSYCPIRAKEANVYLVRKMSASQAPNYFCTRDFKKFVKLSDVHPEQSYIWYKTQLHEWTSLNGQKLQGILYIPENFDSTRRYPLIVHYYERKSDGLNAYISPEVSRGAINIPHFVSNGYLVFTPDIFFQMGDPMQGTFDAVISAVNHLSKSSFIRKDKIGIQGWSFGGWETNYLITHSTAFAAAAETAGAANITSKYGSIVRSGEVNQNYYEIGQGRMKKTLFEIPDLYIKNSPIFNLSNVTTPLLMMHNSGDNAVPFSQAMELFTGLRRLKKKVWLLQYEDGGHGVFGQSALDFSTKLLEFFNHFLKDSPAPDWLIGESIAPQ